MRSWTKPPAACGGATGSRAHRVAECPGAASHRGGGRSAGDGNGQLGRVRDHRRGARCGWARRTSPRIARCRGVSRTVWARAAVRAHISEFAADRVWWRKSTRAAISSSRCLRQIDERGAVRQVRRRAASGCAPEPIAALYAEGRIAHVGVLSVLEEQMLSFGADGLARGRSPDRVDALVWALTDLMLGQAVPPGIRQL